MSTVTKESTYYTNAKLSKLSTGYQLKGSKPQLLTSPLTHSIRATMISSATRELPMPTVTQITSLGQAQATLQHCATKLSKPTSPIDTNGRQRFQQWLEQWERAFTAYLSASMPGMKAEDVTKCRIIKANHLSCTILASEHTMDQKSPQAVEADFAAIVELAAAVLHTRPSSNSSSSSPSPSPTESGLSTSTLGVRDPLYVVAARCDRMSVRNKAIQLLQRTG